jgi:hypothetical protein
MVIYLLSVMPRDCARPSLKMHAGPKTGCRHECRPHILGYDEGQFTSYAT